MPNAILCAVVLSLAVLSPRLAHAQPAAGGAVARPDYLTFAQGAVPVSIDGAGAKLGADFEAAVRIVDGDATGFTIVDRAPDTADTEFVYELPALTTFDRFAVPEIRETPSPSATFARLVEIHGSARGPGDGYVLLASATLATHPARGMVTEIPIAAKTPVRWIKLRLVGGINVMRPESSFEFSEIVGNGTQDVPVMSNRFGGAWRTMGLTLELTQAGPVVSGCYERAGRLTGTVTGNILHATGVTPEGIQSAFILSVADDGSIRGVRSANRSPFRYYSLAADKAASGTCGKPAPPVLGCGSVIHGITFAFDSAEIRPDSNAVLSELYRGLQADKSAAIVIEGHTSSEGSEAYNEDLSERRARAVVARLVSLGLSPGRVSAAGLGESRPIAPNTDEAGRSLNRRVEVHCR